MNKVMQKEKQQIYLDNCCYNRLFDNRNIFKNYIERDVIRYLLQDKNELNLEIAGSDMVMLEIIKNPNREKRDAVKDLYVRYCDILIPITQGIIERAKEITYISNIRERDAVHIAAAEMSGIPIFLSTDEKLQKNANRITINVTVMNPVSWLKEVLMNGNHKKT